MVTLTVKVILFTCGQTKVKYDMKTIYNQEEIFQDIPGILQSNENRYIVAADMEF